MKVDVDFTLALNNATGKFFFSRDMIDSSRDLVDQIYYWRLPFKKKPEGLPRRILGRLALWDVNLHANISGWAEFRPCKPLLFTDPREVIYSEIRSYDIVLCHDVGPISHPDLYHDAVPKIYRKSFEKIKRARPLMLFVSRSSRDEFAERYGTDYGSMRVIFIPPRPEMSNGECVPLGNMPTKYLLTVGAIGRRKNQHQALLAYAKSGLKERGIDYVLCGGPEPGSEAVMDLARTIPGVVLTGYANDGNLRWLYQNALGFVLPSKLEGFGIPAMEAIVNGAMPMVTRGGALNEVTGDAAVLVEDDIDSIKTGMIALADMTSKERQQRMARMTSRIEEFNLDASIKIWRETILDALELYARSQALAGTADNAAR